MKSMIIKVFLVIAALVTGLILWGVFFNGGGVLETAYNAVVTPVNKQWENITGSSDGILPEWTITNSDNLDGTGNNQNQMQAK